MMPPTFNPSVAPVTPASLKPRLAGESSAGTGDYPRAWCELFARRCEVQHITRENRPYLDRYYVAGWSPSNRQRPGSVYLHHFLASDAHDAVHSHPWTWALSLILVGGYREQRCTPDGTSTTSEYRPGDVNVLGPHDRHRIDLLETDCWTLFLTGDYAQPWSFSSPC